jgi:hypothetical protein
VGFACSGAYKMTTEIRQQFTKADSPWIVEIIEYFKDKKLYSFAKELTVIQEDNCTE